MAGKQEKSGGKAGAKKGPSRYAVSGNKIELTGRFCPKCGPGHVMGKHRDRLSCGKCHYTEFQSKK